MLFLLFTSFEKAKTHFKFLSVTENRYECRYFIKAKWCKTKFKKSGGYLYLKVTKSCKRAQRPDNEQAGIWQSKEYAMGYIIHSLLLKENKFCTIHNFKRVKFTVLIEAEIQQYLKRHWGARVWLQSISWSYLTRTVKNSWYYTNTKNSNVSLKRP